MSPKQAAHLSEHALVDSLQGRKGFAKTMIGGVFAYNREIADAQLLDVVTCLREIYDYWILPLTGREYHRYMKSGICSQM